MLTTNPHGDKAATSKRDRRGAVKSLRLAIVLGSVILTGCGGDPDHPDPAAFNRQAQTVEKPYALALSRLVTCMTTLQGFTEKEATKRVFGNADKPSDMEYLSAYIAGQSRGVRMQVSTKDAKEKASYEMGKALFHYRAGSWDFSCASCHGTPNKRIRMQELPVLSSKQGARGTYTTWPGYRVSVSQLKTMEWRINDCFRQQRFPEPTYGSDAVIALTMYMAVNANGAVYRGPGTKR